MIEALKRLGRYCAQTARLMVGVPDYDNYVAHMRTRHPERVPMGREEFFRNRQEARYGGRGGRAGCC